MLSFSYKKLLYLLLISVVFLFPEDILDSLLTVLHYAFEAFELFLEEIIQHVFHVDKQTSQLVVFYILIGIAIYLAVLTYKKLPGFLIKMTARLSLYFNKQMTALFDLWQSLSLLQKTLFMTVYLPGLLYLSSFFVM